MNRIPRLCVLTVCSVAAMVARAEPRQKTSMEGDRANRSEVTIEGLLRDIACPIQNLDGDATHLSLNCVRDCVKAGSPIGILTQDGDLYLTISEKMPDYSQRQKLMPFLGKYVRAKGVSFERNGTRAIVIVEIREMKEVHLTLQGG